MARLNKNQRRFFEEAIGYFGEKSVDVRFKDLSAFASERDLIIPTSKLKEHCMGDVRGHYDLTLIGITPIKMQPKEVDNDYDYEDDTENEPDSEDDEIDSVIIETSSFVPKKAVKKKFEAPKTKEKLIHFNNPVYCVMDGDYVPVAIHTTPKAAFEKKYQVLHDNGMKDFEEVDYELKYRGVSVIRSSNSQLVCIIQKMELLD